MSVLCMGVWWWWRCVSPRGWVCLGETLVFVCLLPVLMSCVRSCSGWGYVLLSPCGVRSLCFPGSVSARAWAVGQTEPFFGMFIVNIIMLYSLQYRYYQVCEIIFLSYFIYYTLYQIDNLRVIDSYLGYWTGYIFLPHLIIFISNSIV